MTAQAALRAGRIAAERLMSDVMRVERLVGKVLDPVSLEFVDSFALVFEGRGKVQAYDGQYEQSFEAGGGNYVSSRSYVHFPVGVGPFEQGDRVTVVSAGDDPSRVGDVFLLEAATGKTLATAQRLPVTRVEAVT